MSIVGAKRGKTQGLIQSDDLRRGIHFKHNCRISEINSAHGLIDKDEIWKPIRSVGQELRNQFCIAAVNSNILTRVIFYLCKL